MYQSEPYEEWHYIQGNIGHGLQLKVALPVHVWIEGEKYAAEQRELSIHAFGEDQIDAILDLRDALIDQYEVLSGRRGRLGPGLERDLAMMDRILAKHA